MKTLLLNLWSENYYWLIKWAAEGERVFLPASILQWNNLNYLDVCKVFSVLNVTQLTKDVNSLYHNVGKITWSVLTVWFNETACFSHWHKWTMVYIVKGFLFSSRGFQLAVKDRPGVYFKKQLMVCYIPLDNLFSSCTRQNGRNMLFLPAFIALRELKARYELLPESTFDMDNNICKE